MSNDDDLGPLFGGPLLRTNRRTRRIGAPKAAADPIWAGSTESEREVVLSVLEVLNAERRTYGMPHLPRARVSPTSGIPIIRRFRDLVDMFDGTNEDPAEVLRCCVRARVKLHATAKDDAVRRGDYSNARVIFDDDDKWESVLNAGRAWARGDRAVIGAPKTEAATTNRKVASHGPRR